MEPHLLWHQAHWGVRLRLVDFKVQIISLIIQPQQKTDARHFKWKLGQSWLRDKQKNE